MRGKHIPAYRARSRNRSSNLLVLFRGWGLTMGVPRLHLSVDSIISKPSSERRWGLTLQPTVHIHARPCVLKRRTRRGRGYGLLPLSGASIWWLPVRFAQGLSW